MDLVIISLKIYLFSPWYSWNIAELALNNNHSLTSVHALYIYNAGILILHVFIEGHCTTLCMDVLIRNSSTVNLYHYFRHFFCFIVTTRLELWIQDVMLDILVVQSWFCNVGMCTSCNPEMCTTCNTGMCTACNPGMCISCNPGMYTACNSGMYTSCNSRICTACNPGMWTLLNHGMCTVCNPRMCRACNTGMCTSCNPRMCSACNTGMCTSCNTERYEHHVIRDVDSM